MFPTGSATTAPVVLRAHVAQDQDGAPGDVAHADVLFDMYAPGNTSGVPNATYPASPDQQGDAMADVGQLATGTWTVAVRTDPSAGFFEAPDSDPVPITVYAPTARGSAAGVGWVHDPGYLDRPVPISTHDHGYFAFDVRLRNDGTPIGVLAYSFAGANGNRYVVSSTGWQRGGVAIARDHATMAGTCDVTVLDRAGHVVSRLRQHAFRLDVTDSPSRQHLRHDGVHARRHALPPCRYAGRAARSGRRRGGGASVS